jgi:hypothetical protein
VLVLEKATLEDRGGSPLHAGGSRFCHDGVEDLRTDILDDMTDGEYFDRQPAPLSEDQFYEILMRITEHRPTGPRPSSSAAGVRCAGCARSVHPDVQPESYGSTASTTSTAA